MDGVVDEEAVRGGESVVGEDCFFDGGGGEGEEGVFY